MHMHLESPQDHHMRSHNPSTFLVAFPIDPALSSYSNPGAIFNWITVHDSSAAPRVFIVPNAYDPSSARKLSYLPDILGNACCGVFCAAGDVFAALWNPSTREVMNVEFDTRAVAGLAFNSAKYIGFGCVKDAEGMVVDIKLLIMLTSDEAVGPIRRFLVYSLRARSWTSLCHPSFPISDILQNGGIYLNGVIHWLAQAAGTAYILTFDLVRDNFGRIPLPCTDGQMDIQDTTKYVISVFDNQHLQFGMVDPSDCLNLWVIRQNGGTTSWVRREVIGPLMKTRLMLGYFDSIGGVISQADLSGNYWFHVKGNASKHDIGINGRSKWYQFAESKVSLKEIANQHQEMPELIRSSNNNSVNL